MTNSKRHSPNILIMMTDQQRYDSLGCYGFDPAHTPNLDRFASQGVLFEHCYVNNPICTPSRASMLTGKHVQGHAVYRLYNNLPDEEVLLPKHLQQLGYQTALIGKLHVSSLKYEAQQRHPNDGFDIYDWCHEPALHLDAPHNAYARWLRETNPQFYEKLCREGRGLHHIPREVHMTHWAAERTIDLIRNRPSDAPFFYMLSVFDPHHPYDDYPLEMADLIEEERLPDPFVVEDELDRLPHILRQLSEYTQAPLSPSSSLEEVRQARLGYNASIALVDMEFGRVLEALEGEGIADDTLVIYLSDHGDMLGDHQQYAKGGALYDPAVRVPFIMRWPTRIAGGQRLSQLIQPHDVAATCLAAAGAPHEELQSTLPDSVDLGALCAGEIEQTHEYAFCVYRNTSLCRKRETSLYFDPPVYATMIRGKRFKMVVYHEAAGGGPHEGLLFDMQHDPLETTNLWNNPDYSDVLSQMTAKLLDWIVGQEIQYLGTRADESIPWYRPWERP